MNKLSWIETGSGSEVIQVKHIIAFKVMEDIAAQPGERASLLAYVINLESPFTIYSGTQAECEAVYRAIKGFMVESKRPTGDVPIIFSINRFISEKRFDI